MTDFFPSATFGAHAADPAPPGVLYHTPAILAVLTQSQTHVSGTASPAEPREVPPAAPVIGGRLHSPIRRSPSHPAPDMPSFGASSTSQNVPAVLRDPAMDKYYAPEANPPLPAQLSQTTAYTWPDSLLDVHPGPAQTDGLPAPAQSAASAPLFLSPSPPAFLPQVPVSEPLFLAATPLTAPAPIPATSAAKRALSSMALGRTLAEDLMDIEAGVPLPALENPVLRNPLLEGGDEIDTILFGHIKPLQGDRLIRAAGVLPEELLPRPRTKTKVPTPLLPTAESLPPTQEPSYVVRSPASTYDDPSLSQSLAHLVGIFPSISSETFTLVLDKTNGDLSAASAWMQSVADVTKAKIVLAGAFPSAPVKEVESSVRLCKGDFLLSFYWLSREYEHTAEWNDFKQVRSKGVMDVESVAPDFIYDDPATEAYEWQWWQIAVSVRSHRVADYPDVAPMWGALASVSTATREVTPRFLDYVCKLGARNTDEAGFMKAVRTLKAQPDFRAIEAIAGPAVPCGRDDPRDAATTILQVLLSDGYISPPAAAWLAIRVSGSSSMYFAMVPLFLAFPVVRRKLWNDRNIHLSAWANTNMTAREGTNSPTGSRISAAEAKSAYSSIVPTAKGKSKHPIFSKVTGKSNAKVAKKVPTRAQTKAAAEKKKRAEIAAIRLAKKGVDIEAQIEAERKLMEEEEEGEE